MKYLDLFLRKVLIVLMALLVLDVLWQVASRYLFKSPSSYTDELARYLLIWVSLLGAAYASGKRLHLSLDIVYAKLKPSYQKIFHVFIHLLIALFSLTVLVYGGIKLVNLTLTMGQNSAALGIPLGYVYLALPISGIIIFIYTVADLFNPPDVAPSVPPGVDEREILPN